MTLRRYKSAVSDYLTQLFSNQGDDFPTGLVWVSIWPTDSAQLENFGEVLRTEVIPDILAAGNVSLVYQLKNTSPSARGGTLYNNFRAEGGGPYAILARQHNIDDEKWTSGLRNNRSEFGTELRHYQLVQRFAGRQRNQDKTSKCIVAVLIEPAPGQEEDIDMWYRKENLFLYAATPMFIRSTRYRLKTNDSSTRLLCLHEFTSSKALLDYAIRNGPIVERTTWSKQVFATAMSVERTVWEKTDTYGLNEEL